MLAENVDFLSYLIYSLSWQLFICFGISHFYFICGKTLLSSNPAGSYHVKKTLLSLLLCFLGLHSVFFSLLNMCAGCVHLKCTAHMCTFDISHQFPEESSRWCVNWCYLFRKNELINLMSEHVLLQQISQIWLIYLHAYVSTYFGIDRPLRDYTTRSISFWKMILLCNFVSLKSHVFHNRIVPPGSKIRLTDTFISSILASVDPEVLSVIPH